MRWGLFSEILVMSWDTIRSNKLRSSLTVLGIVIGITSIVGITSLLRGFEQSFKDLIRQIGPDTIFVQKFSGITASGGNFDVIMRRPNITPNDADAIGELPSIAMTDVLMGGGGGSIWQERTYYRNQRTKPLIIFGTTDRWPYVNSLVVESGRF